METKDENDLENSEAVYADLVRLYPKDANYLRRYAEILIASGRESTATEILRRLYAILIESSDASRADKLVEDFPQIGRIVTREAGEAEEKHPLFEMIEGNLVNVAWAHMHQRNLREGEHLFHKGDTGDSLFLVVKGELAVYMPVEDKGLVLLNLVPQGQVVGERAFLNPGPRMADAVANRKSTVVELPRKRVLAHLTEHPDVERFMIHETELRQMMNYLSINPCLRDAPMDMRQFIAKHSDIRRYLAGEMIYRAGTKMESVDMLIEGEVNYVFTDSAGVRKTLEKLRIGEMVGADASTLKRATCPADLVAESNAVMSHTPMSAFKNVVEAYPPLKEALLQQAEDQITRTMTKMRELGVLPGSEKNQTKVEKPEKRKDS